MSGQPTKNFLKGLKQAGNPERAAHDKKYHRSRFQHAGVSIPKNDALIKLHTTSMAAPEILQMADELWQTQIHDAMIAAGRMLALRLVPANAPVWNRIKKYMRDVDGWALADNLKPAARRCLIQKPELLEDLEKWTRHKNFWFRRAALVFTLHYTKPPYDCKPMLQWMQTYVDDPEWFIQKSIGWWLRELGKYRLDYVIVFLNKYGERLQRVARHEATRRLSATDRRRIISF